MKNKKLLFIGVLTAFLMLAVPFAVVSVDAESADADDIDFEPITNAANLKTALEADGSRFVELTTDICVEETIVLGTGNKTLKLNGYTLTSTAINLFEVNKGINGKLTIDGGNGKIIVDCKEDTGKYPEGHDSEGKDIDSKILFSKSPVSDFTLEVNGGTYSGAEYGFVLYSTNDSNNNIFAKFSNVIIHSRIAAVWCSNGGVENITMDDCVIRSDAIGLYLASVNDAILSNVNVESVDTAIEIKSGNVTIVGGSYSSSVYDVSDIHNVNYNGTGSAVSTICINNAYQTNAVAENTSVTINDNVSIQNDASKNSVVVYIDTLKDSVVSTGDIKLSWKNIDDNVYFAKAVLAKGEYCPTVNKPIVDGAPAISESDNIEFDIDGTKILNDELSVELGVVDTKFLYTITLPSGTEMSEGASITVDEVASGVYDIDFENIDTNGRIIYVTLPFYGKPSDVPIVYYLDDVTGEQIPMDTQLSPDGKSAIFTTTHNSKYIVGVKDSSSESAGFIMGDSGIDSNIIYIAEIVLIALALLGLAAIIRRN